MMAGVRRGGRRQPVLAMVFLLGTLAVMAPFDMTLATDESRDELIRKVLLTQEDPPQGYTLSAVTSQYNIVTSHESRVAGQQGHSRESEVSMPRIERLRISRRGRRPGN